ncbi:hypothetical protein EI94DRAFT_1728941 [Lactarius quietus]|nr:hypothetical protein EI94DRAFT_1728941 [Lactarius quietus]
MRSTHLRRSRRGTHIVQFKWQLPAGEHPTPSPERMSEAIRIRSNHQRSDERSLRRFGGREEISVWTVPVHARDERVPHGDPFNLSSRERRRRRPPRRTRRNPVHSTALPKSPPEPSSGIDEYSMSYHVAWRRKAPEAGFVQWVHSSNGVSRERFMRPGHNDETTGDGFANNVKTPFHLAPGRKYGKPKKDG